MLKNGQVKERNSSGMRQKMTFCGIKTVETSSKYLHHCNDISMKDVLVSFTEAFHVVVDDSGIMVNGESQLGGPEMFVSGSVVVPFQLVLEVLVKLATLVSV